jgi:hypothetical protein
LGIGFTAPSRKKLIVQKPNTRRSRTDQTKKQPRHVKRKSDIRFATWDVLSLSRPGAFKRLKEQLHKWKPEGKRKIGRPRTRWMNDVEADIRKMGFRGWRKKEEGRSEWRKLVKEAKALQGL